MQSLFTFRLSLLDRYMLKCVSWPLAAAIVIGMAALLLERLIRLLDLFANRGGPLTLIMKMLGNLVPHYLAIAMPAAFFVGVLYATLRMSNDSELDVIRGSGGCRKVRWSREGLGSEVALGSSISWRKTR